MINLLKKQVIGLLGMSLLVSCSQEANKEAGVALISDSQNIVSTRGSDEDQFFALIKLKTPALLEKSSRTNGFTRVNAKLRSQIEAEQTEAIAHLKKLDPSVQVVYRYKMVLNGLAVVGPRTIFDHLPTVGLVTKWEKVGNFERSVIQADEINGTITSNLNSRNSSKFIGAEQLNRLGITGKGIKVGVLDTGIDYTHAMFGGAGTAEAFKNVNPSALNPGFPTTKVVGGVDLVGTSYSAGGPEFEQTIPKPDLNPIDEATHGTHVAGTIAGIGDNNVTSYNGMAPEASLYAIKVFGENGSTSDMVVIAGLEFAADPNGDGVLDDQLDVVNLSLGSSYGTPKLLYAEAIKNLVNGGTSAVISAGNSGNVDYIVGSPGATTEALSVASSYDDTEHNWIFMSSKIKIDAESIYVEALEGATTKPIEEAPVAGEFYYIGVADKDLTDDQVAVLTGKVALIDRGVVNFNDKIKRASAGGAIGVVVANNAPGAPILMGTTDKFSIPAIMVTQDVGNKIKAALKAGTAPVSIEFLGDKNIEKPEMIDTISSFSSKGPRSIDGFLKPEITAPGSNIISALSGSGDKIVQMSGTSMAAPHMTGVMALLKQGIKQRGLDLSALELKNIAMGNAKTISVSGKVYPVTRQGAGRVEASEKMINTPIVADVPSLAFGEVGVATKKNFKTKVNFKNISGQALPVSFVFEGHAGIKFAPIVDQTLAVSDSQSVEFSFQMDASLAKKEVEEFGGLVKVIMGGQEVYRLPVLAVVHKISDIAVSTTSVPAFASKKMTVILQNKTPNKGEALFFNALAIDSRKAVPVDGKNIFNTDCDLQSAGYRMVTKENEDGSLSQMIQFAVKSYKPMSTWIYCDVSILFDADGDGTFDQELVGTDLSSIPGQTVKQNASILLDATMAREIRKLYESQLKAAQGDPKQLEALAEAEDYTPAIQDVQDVAFYANSTLAVLQADVSALGKDKKNNLNFKILTTYYAGSSSEFDDYLQKGKTVQGSYVISSDEVNHPFYGFQDNVMNSILDPFSLHSFVFQKGKKAGELIGYYPQNDFSLSETNQDKQQQVIPKK
jgi:minor extracellular serine protease Vpr